MIKELGKTLYLAVGTVLIFQLVGCGTILYPERKGQKSGRIDVGVALLDGVGLFFFLIPGVIAYAVDFSNGTIYLPGSLSSLEGSKNIREVKFDAKHTSLLGLESILKEQTGLVVKFDQPNIRITKLKTINSLNGQFALALPEISNNNRMALNR